MRKHRTLREAYYISFSGLIVIPILLVFFIALSVIRMMVLDSAIAAMKSTQSAITSSLEESVRDASLQLSHFVYVNNNELMRLAAMTDTSDVSQRYHYTSQLDELFQVAMAPKQHVVSGMIYKKDGSQTYLKQETILTREELAATGWFREAVAQKNRVSVGCYDPAQIKITSKAINQKELILAVALAPDIGTDRSDKIEAVVLFIQARVSGLFQEIKKHPELGTTVILDSDGKLLFGMDQDGVIAGSLNLLTVMADGEYRIAMPAGGAGRKQSYTGIISDVPGTDWKVYSCVKTAALTGEFNRIAMLLLLVIAFLFALYIIFSRYFLRTIIAPIQTMVDGLHQVEQGELTTHIAPAGHQEMRTMMHSFNQMTRRLDTSVRENEIAQQKKMEAELRALQSQINPHFLVNTLNSIRFMAQVSKFDGIRRMAEALIRILTCSFRSNHSMYTVTEELEILDSYLYLMKIRYSDGFEVVYEVQESCKTDQIPRLILQPIVENSIVHGFVDMEEAIGRLRICIWEEQDRLYLEVEDNGKGMTAEEIAGILYADKTSATDNYRIGVSNVLSRLKLNFGEACSMKVESEPGRFCRTILCLPISRGEGGVR